MMPQETIELTRARLALRAARTALVQSVRLDTWTPEIQSAFHAAEAEVDRMEATEGARRRAANIQTGNIVRWTTSDGVEHSGVAHARTETGEAWMVAMFDGRLVIVDVAALRRAYGAS